MTVDTESMENVQDWTSLLAEYDYQRPERGQLREGIVMRVEDNQILVDIGAKHEGVIPNQDLRRLPPEMVAGIKNGDTLQVYVMEPETKEGDLVLSLNMVQVERDWQDAQAMLESGQIIEASVVGYNKGGLLVQVGRVRGFVPASQVVNLHSRTGAEGQQSAMTKMVGQSVPLKVIEVDRERNRLVLSERSWQRVNHPREVLQPGQEVQVYVLEIDRERERIGLSLRRLQPDPWATIDQRYDLGQIITGEVTNIAPFGVFVRVEEGVEGLIHASELTESGASTESLQPGMQVQVKVISLDRQRQRLGLSLRRVEGVAETAETVESNEPEAAEEEEVAA